MKKTLEEIAFLAEVIEMAARRKSQAAGGKTANRKSSIVRGHGVTLDNGHPAG
jgi:hypothetical protein